LLVDPRDTEAIRDGLRRLLDDATLRSALAQAARLRAQHFRWDRCASESFDFLKRFAR